MNTIFYKTSIIFCITSLIAILMMPINSFAQAPLKGLLANHDEVFEKALTDVLFIVRQDYVLRDTSGAKPQNYGRDGNDYFGRSYTLGILAEGQIWTNAAFRKPWENDPNYEAFKSEPKVYPLLSDISVRAYNKTTFNTVASNKIGELSPEVVKSGLFTIAKKTNNKGIGFGKLGLDEVSGWLVKVSSKSYFGKNENQELFFDVRKITVFPQVGKNRLEYQQNKKAQFPALGELFITANYEAGQVHFQLAGIPTEFGGVEMISRIPEVDQTALTNYLTIKLEHKDGFPLCSISGIVIEGKNYKTNERGEVVLPLDDEEQEVVVMLGGKVAGCGKAGETIRVICQYTAGVFLPKKAAKCGDK